MVERLIEQGPEIKPGERYPWSYSERIGQMGRFGPASMAYYLGWISMALATIAGVVETYLAFQFGRSIGDKIMFAAATLALSAAITVMPTPLYYFSRNKGHEGEGWMGRWFLGVLVIISLMATALFVTNSFDPRLVPDINDIFRSSQNPQHETKTASKPAYIVPYYNAEQNLSAKQERYDYVKRWCDGGFLGVGRDQQACADLGRAERDLGTAKREFQDSKDARFGPDAPPEAPYMTPRDYAHLVFAILVLWLLQISRLILPYIASEGGKDVMLERFGDKPAPVLVRVNGEMPIEEEGLESIDTFEAWRGDRVIQDTAARGTKFSDFFQDYQRFCWKNPAFRDHALDKNTFSNRWTDYIETLGDLAKRRHSGGSGGSNYDGVKLRS